MGTITLSYSDDRAAALDLSPEAFAREATLVLAVRLFEPCRLTSEQAAELAGVGRARFLLERSRFGAASVSWNDKERITEVSEA